MEAKPLTGAFATALSALGARALFVDTGAFYAVQTPGAADHESAVTTWSSLLAQRSRLVTTNAVVGETYTLFRSRQGYAAAWRFIDWLDSARPVVTRRYITEDLEIRAYAILRQYQDQNFSFVDGTSFAFMRSLGITDAFAFDAHFATAGFTRVPLDRPVS